uniref:mitogen-activated protein kinase kinase kinase 18-like n=1 Tax=Erigeron canadensis TaxID=72917 RepID=UPI001CB88C41|nr:mitogen-activated protein kinase kinase kinase 18-like [Erigeron canadensis]
MGWTRGHVLGHGSSATVSTATTATGETFAVKSVVVSKSETLQREQQFLSILSSPYVVSYTGCDITKENKKMIYNLLMEYMPGGTVIDVIQARNYGSLNELEIANYTRQIIQGLEYIHSFGIVHCDIKGANILVNKNGVKIADFGCAKWANEDVPFRGTPMFMAPEVARGESQGFKADIWALGCVIIEMAIGNSPWSNVNSPISVLYKIGFSGESPDIPDGFSPKAKDFIKKCLIQDPEARWSATALLKHPFLEQFDHDQDQNFLTCSPTSILDQDVWGSIQQSALVGSDYNQETCTSNSLRQRVEQLAGNPEKGKFRSGAEKEIDWMTIRSSCNGAVTGGDEWW